MSTRTRWILTGVMAMLIGAGIATILLRDTSAPATSVGAKPVAETVASEPEATPVAPKATPAATVEEKAATEATAAAFPSAKDRPDRTGRGRIFGKAATPADGPRGLEITIALHGVPDYESRDFTYDETLIGTTTAAADGSYEFKGLSIGSYVLLASTTGYTINGSGSITAQRMEDQTDLNLVPGGDIAGRVVNQAGQPVANAHVFVGAWDIQGQQSFAPRERSLASQRKTDDKGVFTITNLRTSLNNEPGYKLAVKAEGYGTFLSDYIRAGTQGVEFILKPGGVVSGMLVSTTDGAPIPDKIVALASELTVEQLTAKTDAEGFFFVADVPPGEQMATLKDDDLVLTPESAKFNVVDGTPTEELVLQATRGGRISGRAYDTGTGDGIPNVSIYITNTDRRNQDERRHQVTTGADGTYLVKGLRSGSYTIEYRKPDGYPEPNYRDPDRERLVTADLGQETTGVDFKLSRGLTIAGRVLDEDGKPLAEAQVNAQANQGNAYDYVRTKADGSFIVAGFSENQKVNVSAQKEGYGPVSEKNPREIVSLENKSVTGITLKLGPQSTISGTVVDSAGRPKGGVEMYAIRSDDSNYGSNSSGRSGADGSVKFTQLGPGEYGIIFTENGGWSSDQVTHAQKFRVAKGQDLTGVKILFADSNTGGLSITGRVVDTQGKGIARATIRLEGPWREVTADAAGNYTVGGLTAGSYTLMAASYAHSGADRKTAEAGAKGVDFVLKGLATISGQVLSKQTGRPVTAFRVRATGQQRQQYFVRDEFQSVRDAEGRFKLNEVEDGATKIEVRSDDFADASVSIPAVAGGESREGVVVRMDDGIIVAGRVLDGNGRGVSGAQIFLGAAPQEWQMEKERRALSGSDGGFRITSLPPGQMQLSAAHPKFAPKTVSVNLVPGIENKTDIVLSAGGTVEGRVTKNRTTPVAGQYIYAQFDNNNRQTQTDNDGRFTLSGLPDGKINVGANLQIGGSGRSKNSNVDVKDGYVTEVNFDFSEGTAILEGTVYAEEGVPLAGEVYLNVSVQTATGEKESYGAQLQKGAYRIEGVAAGTATIRVYAQQGGSRRVTVEVPDGARVRKDIFLNGGGILRVTVSGTLGVQTIVWVLSGEVRITEFSRETLQTLESQMVSQGVVADGQATLTGLDAGTVTLLVISLDATGASSGDPFANAKWTTETAEVILDKETDVRVSL